MHAEKSPLMSRPVTDPSKRDNGATKKSKQNSLIIILLHLLCIEIEYVETELRNGVNKFSSSYTVQHSVGKTGGSARVKSVVVRSENKIKANAFAGGVCAFV